MVDIELQQARATRELLKRRVKNYEFAQMHILSHTKVLSNIRQVYGSRLHKERIYLPDHNGKLKATGVFEYWITPERKTVTNAMKYEESPTESNWLITRLRMV